MGINFKNKNFQTCKFSLRPSPVRQSLLRSSHLTPSRTSRLRSKIRKVSHPISRDLSSPVSSSRMEEPFPTTTSRRNPLSISSLDSEVVCRSSSRLSLERPAPSRSSHLTPLRTSRPRFKIRKESHPISRDLSSLVSSSRMEEPFLITTFKRNPLFISCSDSEVVCRSSLRPSQERPSLLRSSQATPSRTSRPRSRTRKVSLPISRDSSLLESSLRTAEPFLITTSRRNLPSILSLDSVEASEAPTEQCIAPL